MPSDPELLVLHALRLASGADVDGLVLRTGLEPADISRVIGHVEPRGWVRHRDRAPIGWVLEPAGRREAAQRVADEVAASGTADAVRDCYDEFLVSNTALLDICTRWQLRAIGSGTVVNDHSDAVYDDGVIDELRRFDASVRPWLDRLAATLDRFGGYGARLANALRRVEAGKRDWFTKPTIDSYHTVWFELHEDLLATLGLERSSERAR